MRTDLLHQLVVTLAAIFIQKVDVAIADWDQDNAWWLADE